MPRGFEVSLLTGQMNMLWNEKSAPRSTSQAISLELNPAIAYPFVYCPNPSAFWAVRYFGRLYEAATVAINSGLVTLIL